MICKCKKEKALELFDNFYSHFFNHTELPSDKYVEAFGDTLSFFWNFYTKLYPIFWDTETENSREKRNKSTAAVDGMEKGF